MPKSERPLRRTTISLPADIMDDAEERCRSLHYPTFSAYISFLIEADVQERPNHKTCRTEQGSTVERFHPSRLNEGPVKMKKNA